jgi:glycosyltransferase involved in cell wall biosynthesis
MRAKSPRISVGLPVYNGENYVSEAIQSILSQDFEDFELIISDNASTDSTAEICRHFAEQDARVKYSRLDSNCGALPNYQRVFRLAEAPFFKWAAHDDICLRGMLGRCLAALEESPQSVVMVYPRSNIINERGQVTEVAKESIACHSRVPHVRLAQVLRHVDLSCAMFGLMRSDTMRRTRLLDSFIGSDYVLLSEMAMLGEIVEIPDILFQKRIHQGVSHVAQKSSREWLAWLDTSRSRKLLPLPTRMRIAVECVKSATRLPMPLTERVLCQVVGPLTWYSRYLRGVAGASKKRLIEAVDGFVNK